MMKESATLTVNALKRAQAAVDEITKDAKHLRITRKGANEFVLDVLNDSGEAVLTFGEFTLYKKDTLTVNEIFKPMKVSVGH